VGIGCCSTFISIGTIRPGQSGFGGQNMVSGEWQPWSIGRSWNTEMSNSSLTRQSAMWRASAPWPFSGGTGRGPRPSSAIGYSSLTPSAKVG
jgi:hypothetical protein